MCEYGEGGQFDLEGAAGSDLQPQGCCSLGLASRVSLRAILSCRVNRAYARPWPRLSVKNRGKKIEIAEARKKAVVCLRLRALLGSANPPVD